MSMFHLSIGNGFAIDYAARAVRLRLGRRELLCCRAAQGGAFGRRPLLACRAGAIAGHLELAILRTWLVVLSGRRLAA